ncbi:MAG: dihydroorotase [Coriobacteriia bacterium]|nr:dihydroorotase [Coriobacteriia bacterium]
MALLLKGGRVIDPKVDLDGIYDVVIRDGVIQEIGSDLSIPKGVTCDCTGRIILPGLFDMHTHLREPGYEYKEDIESGTRAAVKGGFTGIACMPNTHPVADNSSVIDFIKKKAAQSAHCRVYPIGAITKNLEGEDLTEMADMLSAGAVAFSDDGKGIQNAGVMRQAMDYAKMFPATLIAHEEDKSLVGSGCVNEGPISTKLGLPGQPGISETIAAQRDIELCDLTGCRLHVAHVSSYHTVDALRDAKKRGIPVTAEVTPHHLLLTEDDLSTTYDTNLKMNPPLRSKEDRAALIEGLLDGTIDCIASDHAPHAPHEKEREFERAAYGTTGLETSLSLMLTHFVAKGIFGYGTLVEKMSDAPRRALGIDTVTIEKGSCADLTIIDPNYSFIVDTDERESKARNSAFVGWELTGRASDVLIAGYFKMRDGEVVE